MKCYICENDFPVGAMHNVEYKKKVLKYCDSCYKKAVKTEEYFSKVDTANESFFRRGSNETAHK